MEVTCVGIKPTKTLIDENGPMLTPELLAACGARYSRNGEGLHAILDRVADLDEDAAVDSIFKMVDYGHQSIADMVPIAMFIDRVSLWLALRVWTLCPTAGGQESSTRYLRLDPDSTVYGNAQSNDEKALWLDSINNCFNAYQRSLDLWTKIADEHPEIMRLPQSLISSEKSKDKKRLRRMVRNFAFDRARYFLPMCATTNVMLLMSARGWVALIKQLASERLAESRMLADNLRNELVKVAPRMVKHACEDESYVSGFTDEFDRLVQAFDFDNYQDESNGGGAFLDVFLPKDVDNEDVVNAVRFHKGRYDFIGSPLQRTSVRFGWQALPIAEIRDLNRHRTGTKYFNLNPVSYYYAEDQIAMAESSNASLAPYCDELRSLSSFGKEATRLARHRIADGKNDFVYWLPMGAECYYEHTTTANHFLYQAELRTGLGAHYHYARRMKEVLDIWHSSFPETAEFVKAGTAEPE